MSEKPEIDLCLCPFCGEAPTIAYSGQPARYWYATCQKCDAQGPAIMASGGGDIPWKAIAEAWNRRAPAAPAGEPDVLVEEGCCRLCGRMMGLDEPDYEPTDICHQCAHNEVDRLSQEVERLKAHVELGRINTYAAEKRADTFEQQLAARDAEISALDRAEKAAVEFLERAESAEAELTALRSELAEAKTEIAGLREALEFYAEPETYFAIGFFSDPPCGEFIDDFDDTGPDLGVRPGKRARAALGRKP